MKAVILLGMLIGFINAKGTIYKTRQPIIYRGQVYAALLNIDDTGHLTSKNIALNFYLLKPEKGNIKSFESFGGYSNVKRVFVSETAKEFKLVQELSTQGNDGLCRFTRCFPTFSKDKIDLVLTEFREFNNIKISLYKVYTNLNVMDQNDLISDLYKDEVYVNRLKTNNTLDKNNSIQDQLFVNFIPRFIGNIDSKEFPLNRDLINFLKNNTDFVFRISKEFYLDLLRFKANMFEYDSEKFTVFLKTYDLWFIKYQDNPELLDRKINTCIRLLKNAIKFINLGDIYYKEFPIYARDVDLNSCHFEFITPEVVEGYSTKKIIGEDDAFYLSNGLSIYISNWGSLKSLNLSEAQTHPFLSRVVGNPKPVTFRVYFLLQPFPVFSDEGEFKGITAYGIKSMLYNPCSINPLLSADNGYLKNISDSVVKRCYFSSVNYLNKYFSQKGCNANMHVAELYYDNFIELGTWHQPFPNCEIAYVYMSGKIKKVSDHEKVLCLRMMTNYKTTFQAGNKVTFKNNSSGVFYNLPLTDASIKLTGNKGGYYNLEIKIPTDIYKKLLSSHINSFSFQCLGEPEYLVNHDFFYLNPNEEITAEINEINTSFAENSDGDAPKLEGFLRLGL